MSENGKCVEREKIFAFRHHMLEPAEEAEVRHHLDVCGNCQRISAGYERLERVLDEWKAVHPSPQFDALVKEALARRGPWESFRTLFAFPAARALAMATVALFVVGGSLLVYQFRRDSRHVGPVPSATVNHAAASTNMTLTGSPGQALLAEEELKMYQELAVLEDYDMLESFDVLSEIPAGKKKLAN